MKQFASHSGVQILLTGIGRQNAERVLKEFLDRSRPRQVFSCGFAGGLAPSCRVGDVLFETREVTLRDQLTAAGAAPATFHCADRIATTVAEKRTLRDQTGAGAVEMESAAIHAICRERAIPCATVRVVSDTAHEDLPLDFNQLSNPDRSLNYGKLAWAVAKSPSKIPALMQLQKNCRLAAERLAGVLTRVICSE